MRRVLLLALLLAAPALHAGLWDRDRQPDDRLPAVADLAAGLQTPRPPALVERRRAAALEALHDAPATVANLNDAARADLLLPAFDDAAVAEARLGRFTEAIILLDRKQALATSVAELNNQRAHDTAAITLLCRAELRVLSWLAAGAPRGNLSDLRAARADLEAAAQFNAHAREAAHELRRVDWLLAGAPAGPQGSLPNLLALDADALAGPRNPAALAGAVGTGAVEWLTRRLHHGVLRRDVDAMYALSLACALAGRPRDAAFCWFRLAEWARAGATSTVPGAPTGDALAERMKLSLGDAANLAAWRAEFDAACQNAETINASRLRYMEQGLARGESPDNQPDYWARWNPGWDAPLPPEAAAAPENELLPAAMYVGAGTVVLVLFCVVAGFAIFVARAHPRSPTVKDL